MFRYKSSIYTKILLSYVNTKQVGTVVFLHHRRDVMEDMTKARMVAQKNG